MIQIVVHCSSREGQDVGGKSRGHVVGAAVVQVFDGAELRKGHFRLGGVGQHEAHDHHAAGVRP